MRYIPILFLIVISNCTYYLYKDATLYLLTKQEKQIFNSKKILYIGLDYVEIRRIPVRQIFHSSQKITVKEHLKIIEFINSSLIDNSTTEFQKNYLVRKERDTIEEGYLNTGIRFSSFDLKQTELNRLKTKENIDIENLKNFLINYLKTTKHLGFHKIDSILEFENDQVNLKLKDFDYILVGVGKLKEDKDRTNRFDLLFSLYSLGLIPFFTKAYFETNLYLYDKNLNLVKKIETINKIQAFTSWWVFFPNDEEIGSKAFEKDIAEFLKESVKEIK